MVTAAETQFSLLLKQLKGTKGAELMSNLMAFTTGIIKMTDDEIMAFWNAIHLLNVGMAKSIFWSFGNEARIFDKVKNIIIGDINRRCAMDPEKHLMFEQVLTNN